MKKGDLMTKKAHQMKNWGSLMIKVTHKEHSENNCKKDNSRFQS